MLNRLAVLAAIVLVHAACGGAGEDSGAPAGKRFLSIGTAPPGGAFFVVGGALGEVLSASGPGWSVTAEATKGSQENIRRLDTGEIDVALSNASITYFAARGEEGWEKAYPIAGVMTLAPNVAMFLTPRSSGIQSIPDLKGKRVVVGPSGAGWEAFVRRILEAHGVSYQDITPLNNTQTAAVDMLTDGSAASAILGGAVPTASIVQATTSQDILLIPFEEQAARRLVEEYPFFEEQIIPAGTYNGQDEEFHGLDVGSMHLIASANADEELIYQITKTIYENREKVTEKHPAGAFIRPDNVVRDVGVPFHPGAIRYYREIGIWPESTS